MRTRIIILLIFGLMLSSCAKNTLVTQHGVTFTNEPINRALPNDFKNRVFYKKTDILKYDLTSLVGWLLVCTSDSENAAPVHCDLMPHRMLKPNTTPMIQTPDQKVYTSKVDRNAQTEGSYLLFTAGFTATQVAEVTIMDTSLVMIPLDDMPVNQLQTYVQKYLKNPAEKRYWIEGALLSAIVIQDYTQIGANASGAIGPISGINGAVYQGQQTISYDYAIALELIDIDRANTLDPQSRSSTGGTPNPILTAPERAITIEAITGLEKLSIAK